MMANMARASARYKNQDGSLALTAVSLEWTKHAKNNGMPVGNMPDLTIAVRDVKVHAVSAATSKRMLLKVVTASRDPKAAGFVFEFNAKLSAKAEREVPFCCTICGTKPADYPGRCFLTGARGRTGAVGDAGKRPANETEAGEKAQRRQSHQQHVCTRRSAR